MPQKIKPRVIGIEWAKGEQTTRLERNEDYPALRRVLNGRVDSGGYVRRGGMVALTKTSNTGAVITFDGTNDAIGITHDSRAWALSSIPEWTIEGLCNPTNYSATRTILARNTSTANDVDLRIYMDSTSSGRIVVELKDDGGTTTTIAVTGIAAGTLTHWRLTKAATGTYTLTANGTSATGTLTSGVLKANTADPLAIGRANGGGLFFIGPIEFVRGFKGVRVGHFDSRSRLLDPRADDVLFDYVCEVDANNYCLDRSRFGNHGAVTGSPATTASIAHNHAPILGMGYHIDQQGRRRLVYQAGSVVYGATL